MMCSNGLDSKGKPAVSPMSGSPTFDIGKKNRNSANLKLRHALRAGGVIICHIHSCKQRGQNCKNVL